MCVHASMQTHRPGGSGSACVGSVFIMRKPHWMSDGEASLLGQESMVFASQMEWVLLSYCYG